MKQWMVPVSLVLAGCVATGLSSGLQALAGQDISAAVKLLGYPSGARTTAEGTIYMWSNSAGAANPQSCTIQITADAAHRIKRGQYTGDPRACAPYEKALNSLNP